ncbi:hypothetical protein K469DRAFT_32476 [Zopfia rhizophila CBS 207.26]|uniref:Uncharacterized protein n=1 Tax=Zopfia rhizophila CBS 207.26 TaxID=1314779 RepID=A0A6A6DDF2_9PEZI|nr:hypothetical protein K469DRAFT_32476 [Zopfia rhizophila CBS 207.26]
MSRVAGPGESFVRASQRSGTDETENARAFSSLGNGHSLPFAVAPLKIIPVNSLGLRGEAGQVGPSPARWTTRNRVVVWHSAHWPKASPATDRSDGQYRGPNRHACSSERDRTREGNCAHERRFSCCFSAIVVAKPYFTSDKTEFCLAKSENRTCQLRHPTFLFLPLHGKLPRRL